MEIEEWKSCSFSGATVQWIDDYAKPSLRYKPNHLILHIRVSHLSSSKTAESIATSILEQAITLKDKNLDVSVSDVVIRKDYLKRKAEEVNSHLKVLCMKKIVFVLDHSKSIRQCYLDKSRLHLNFKGSAVLGETLLNHLSNIYNLQLEKGYVEIVGCNDEHMRNSPYHDNLKFIRKGN